jgi:glycosyltransferase involved in cell wall biosynthesis
MSGNSSATEPLVTVIVDTYNQGRYIEEAIDSVLAQEYAWDDREGMEVLVVDDGSDDDTPDRVKKYGAKVQYLRKANGGQASAFRTGLERARGEIVAFLDGDDAWMPGKLRRMIEEFSKQPDAGMVYHRLREFDERSGQHCDGDFVGVSGAVPDDQKKLMSYILYPTSALAFRRNCLDALLPIPEELRIQADAYLSALAIFVAPVVAIDEPLGIYRIHGSNLFRANGREEVEKRAEQRIATRRVLLKGMREWLKANEFRESDADVRAYLSQWEMAQQEDEYTLRTPGRIEFCRHLLKWNYTFGVRITRRHVAVNYLNAVGALVVGYKHFGLLDVWRNKVLRGFREPSNKTPEGRPVKRVA